MQLCGPNPRASPPSILRRSFRARSGCNGRAAGRNLRKNLQGYLLPIPCPPVSPAELSRRPPHPRAKVRASIRRHPQAPLVLLSRLLITGRPGSSGRNRAKGPQTAFWETTRTRSGYGKMAPPAGSSRTLRAGTALPSGTSQYQNLKAHFRTPTSLPPCRTTPHAPVCGATSPTHSVRTHKANRPPPPPHIPGHPTDTPSVRSQPARPDANATESHRRPARTQ